MGSILGREESRVFDGVEDVEIGKSANNTEEDNSLYGCIGRMKGKRPEKEAHGSESSVEDPGRERESKLSYHSPNIFISY